MPYTLGCMDSLLAIDPNPEVGIFRWWQSQRWKYNIGMLVAGPTAFVLYAIATWIWVPMPEITLFTMLFQGIGYLFAMGLANLFYFLGPLGEMLVSLRKRAAYRRVVFSLGVFRRFTVLDTIYDRSLLLPGLADVPARSCGP